MSRYSPEVASLAKTALARMRNLLPNATAMVYDNYNALVIGFGPSDRASEAVLSIALYPRWVMLFFLKGATLNDPDKLLKGSGKQVRSIVLEDAATLDRPEVVALIGQAAKAGKTPIEAKKGNLIIKSVSVVQRPRRPAQNRKRPLARVRKTTKD